MTDSGGLQKEVAFLNKKCVVIFEYTPWKELEKAGYIHVWNDLNKEELFKELNENYFKENIFEIFGNGKASEIIVDKIINFLYK